MKQKVVKNALLGLLGGLTIVFAAYVFFPWFSNSGSASRPIATLSNLKELGTALLIYTGNNDDRFPLAMSSGETCKPALLEYVKNPEIFESLNGKSKQFLGNGSLDGMALTWLSQPEATLALFDSNSWPDGKRCVLFADFHARRRTEQDFQGAVSNLWVDPWLQRR